MRHFQLNGAQLLPGMSLREQAKEIAKANNAVVVTVSSHNAVARLFKQYNRVEFYSPVNLGSKSRLYICKSEIDLASEAHKQNVGK